MLLRNIITLARRCYGVCGVTRVAPPAERALASRSIFDFMLKTSASALVSPVLHEGGQGLHAGSDGTDGEARPGSRVWVGEHGLDHVQSIGVPEQTEPWDTSNPQPQEPPPPSTFLPWWEHQQTASASCCPPALQEVGQKLLQVRRREAVRAPGMRRVHRQAAGEGISAPHSASGSDQNMFHIDI